MNVFLPDERATEALATRLAAAMPPSTAGLTLLLRGDLGAGKSTFARALIRSLGHAGAVPSPTYTLVEPYDLPGGMVYHVDLYRVSSEDELRYLGWTELDEGFRIVEGAGHYGQGGPLRRVRVRRAGAPGDGQCSQPGWQAHRGAVRTHQGY
jgi:tRNA threonylcarbamoyladenosine biosynthesis protein TsaE